MPLTTSGNLPLPIRNIHSAVLRGAGIRVTSARIATLRLAPLVLAAHGRLSPQLLHAAAVEQGGMHVSTSAFYNTLSTLTAAGLLPSAPAAHASATPAIVSVQE
ncbi:MAG TPA: hypothetical protein VF513_15080 [Stenotrophomonas sp.]|jgi:Fe2+ or Zn2+ uptake regulation protein